MAKYNTNQRKVLTDYLGRNHDIALSVQRIAEDLGEAGISVSAVYRNLAALEEEGVVRRIAKNGDRAAFYQYVGAKDCKNKIHLSCMNCGKTYHLPSAAADILAAAITDTEGFRVDRTETVIYGVCRYCHA